MFKITVDSTQVRAMANWLGKFDETVKEPQTISAGVRLIGMGMDLQFKSEGRHGGNNWQPLSPATQILRVNRGYNPEHPILRQTGSLQNATADALKSYLTDTVGMMRVSPGVSMMASSQPLLFTAKVSGPKVQNHFGGQIVLGGGGKGFLPRRPFFGISGMAADMAFEAIYRRVIMKWATKSKFVTRVG